jgi:hypothetical protein
VLYDIELPVATEDARYSGGVLLRFRSGCRHRRHNLPRPGASRRGGTYDMVRSRGTLPLIPGTGESPLDRGAHWLTRAVIGFVDIHVSVVV